MSSQLPRNAYTHTPELHPNLILGSLQLLLWLSYHPTALRNHVKRIKVKGLWRNQAWWRLLLQGCFILPSLAYLLTFWRFGVSALVAYISFSIGFFVVEGLVSGAAFILVKGLVSSTALIVVAGLVSALPSDVQSGIVLGLFSGVAFSVGCSVTWNQLFSYSSDRSGLVFGVAFAVPLGVAICVSEGITLSNVAKGITFILMFIPFISFMFLFSVFPIMIIFGLFFRISDPLLYRLDQRRTHNQPSLLRYNSTFWLDVGGFSLDKHLLLVMERNPIEGKAAIDYLYLKGTPQRRTVQAVQIEIDARQLERCTDVEAIRKIHRTLPAGQLEDPANHIFYIFHRLSEDVDAALNQNSIYNQRKALEAVANGLDLFLQGLTKSNDKYDLRFRPVATHWQEILTNHIRELIEASELRQEIDDPYIFGNPLDHRLEVFMGRTSIGIRIEKLILDRRRPPLFLYGQRRIGKTSLLNNLGRLLPNSIIPMFVDLQGPTTLASNHAGFLYNLAKAMRESAQRQSDFTLPSLTREKLATDPFTHFDEWLDEVEHTLDQNTALLALDEFEALDSAINKGRFDEEDVLGMLRHIIQHRPHFKILLAGSHTLQEFQRWASYLINVQVVHISYLTETEARQLIEHPIKEFTLRYEPDAVQRVLNLTRCHPCLVQLLCSEIVALKNEQHPSVRRLATVADVEAAVPEALSTGSFFFADIQNNQIDALGLAILRHIAARGEGATVSRKTIAQQFPDCNRALNLLLQRELIEEIEDSYRFQVELIGRWFA